MRRGNWVILVSVLSLLAGAPGVASAQDNSCLYALDGECDEGSVCAVGTDSADCKAAAKQSLSCAAADDDDCAPAGAPLGTLDQETSEGRGVPEAQPPDTGLSAAPEQPADLPAAEAAREERAPAAGAAAAPTGGEPSGLYLMQIYWFGTRSLEHDAYLFQNGQVATSPNGDIRAFDFAAARSTAPDTVGAYEMRGDTMVIAWGNGQRQESAIEWNGGCFHWDARSFCPAKPFAAEALDGSYSGGASISTSFGSAMSSQSYVFAPDGRYRLDAAGSVSSESDESKVSGGSTGGDAGRYRIDGLTLTLFPEGGEPRAMTAFPFSDGADPTRPDYIFLGGVMLRRQG